MIKLRIAAISDAKALSEIYGYYVKNTTVSFEYDAPDESEFASRIAEKLKKYPFIVAEEDGVIFGYAYASSFRDRAAYDWDAELSIYVSHGNYRRGIGKRLYSALLALLKLQHFANAYAVITCPNDPSVAFHEKLGFTLAGKFHKSGYKHGEWLDFVCYEKSFDHPVVPERIIPFSALDKNDIEKILSANQPPYITNITKK